MKIKPLKTHPVTVNDSLNPLIDSYVPKMEDKQILVVTSKIVSICEGSVVCKSNAISKEELIYQSADAYLNEEKGSNPYCTMLTIKNNILIPSAGIDESNGNGVYILYPKDVQESAIKIWQYLCERDGLKEMGVLITDSHTTPLRRGVMGVGLGWCGFKPLYSYIGKPDCFNKPLRITMTNIIDSLAAAAVFCMGEGNEQTPLAIITDAPKIEFQTTPPTKEEIREFTIPIEEDLYAPLLNSNQWIFKN